MQYYRYESTQNTVCKIGSTPINHYIKMLSLFVSDRNKQNNIL